MLAREGTTGDPRPQRGIDWLLREQEADGSWFGRWGANYVYGTGAVVPALVAAGVAARTPAIRRAVALAGARPEPRRRLGRGPALLRRPRLARPRRLDRVADGLGAAGPARGRRARPTRSSAGSSGSSATQREDGTWDEPYFTGTGFPGDFSINYHLYRLVFPITALGAARRGDRSSFCAPLRRRGAGALGSGRARRAWASRTVRAAAGDGRSCVARASAARVDPSLRPGDSSSPSEVRGDGSADRLPATDLAALRRVCPRTSGRSSALGHVAGPRGARGPAGHRRARRRHGVVLARRAPQREPAGRGRARRRRHGRPPPARPAHARRRQRAGCSPSAAPHRFCGPGPVESVL